MSEVIREFYTYWIYNKPLQKALLGQPALNAPVPCPVCDTIENIPKTDFKLLVPIGPGMIN